MNAETERNAVKTRTNANCGVPTVIPGPDTAVLIFVDFLMSSSLTEEAGRRKLRY
jgi:hypothetical protein